MVKLKQGQTWYQSVVYDPDKLEGYPNEYVGIVWKCFITKVQGSTIEYRTSNGCYISGTGFFRKNKFKTIRKASKNCQYTVDLKNNEMWRSNGI